MAMPSNPLLRGRFGVSMPRNGFCGDLTPGRGIGASSSTPRRSVWRRNGPNSSPNQNVPSGGSRNDSMSKAPRQETPRLNRWMDWDNAVGIQRAVRDDREVHVTMWIAQRDERLDVDHSGS